MRKFIRHPSSIPVQIREIETGNATVSSLVNVSYGGLALHYDGHVQPGTEVELSIIAIDPRIRLRGIVMWCRAHSGGYELGLMFQNDNDVFRLRMVEQLCHIEDYRREEECRQGRSISSEEAAAEWIEKFAGTFPATD